MIGLRNLSLELDAAKTRLTRVEIEYSEGIGHLRTVKAARDKVKYYKDEILKAGVGAQISIITFSTNWIFYPTHDDSEIKILMARDYQGIEEYTVSKIFTGELNPSIQDFGDTTIR